MSTRLNRPHDPDDAPSLAETTPLASAALPAEMGTLPPSLPAEMGTLPPSLPAAGDVPNGVAVPGYEVLGLLGRGGMGVVYKARQIQADRVVALKMILHAEHAGEDEHARFQTEARAIARLQHVNIVQIHEVGEHRGVPFFSLEYCPGGALNRKLAGTPLEAKAAAALVEKLAHAMQAAHQANVIHRDLKPGNVLLTAEGEPKITDFGLAKRLDEQGRTQTGAVMGTPSYMAPEQASGSKEVGAAADTYALGAILYECLTGRPPFKAAMVMDTLKLVVSEEPASPRQLNPRIPADLETICLKCLRKEPARRYATATDLAEDLRRFQRGEPILARPVGRLERSWRWIRRNPVLATALAAVAVSLIGGTLAATLFALQANEARTVAEQRAESEADAKQQARQNEARANEQKAAAEVARNDLAAANDRLRSSVARSLVRPLGLTVARHQPNVPLPGLADAEIDALWELEETAEEQLWLRFVQEAVRNRTTSRQLRYRAAFALHAAVGLDVRRRDAVEHLLVERLAGNELSTEERTDLALSLASLGNLETRTARQTATILAQTLSKGQAQGAEARTLARGLAAAAACLEPKETATILTRTLSDPIGYDAPQDLVPVLAAAARLEPNEAATILTQAMRHTRSYALRGLSPALMTAASHLQPPEATKIARETIFILRRGNPIEMTEGARCLKAAAARMEPKEASALCLRAVMLYAPLISKEGKVSSRYPSELSVLAMVAEHLQPREARQAAAVFTRAMSKITSCDALSDWFQRLRIVAARMEPKEASVVYAQMRAILTELMSKTTALYARAKFAHVLAMVETHREPKEAAALLIQAMSEQQNNLELQALLRDLKEVAVRLEPKEARDVTATLLQTMNKVASSLKLPNFNNTLPLLMLSQSLAAVALRLEPKEASAACAQAATILTPVLSKSNVPAAQSAYWGALAALARFLEAKEASATCAQAAASLNQTLNNPRSRFEFRVLPQALAAASARLTPAEASARCAAAAAVLIEAMRKPAYHQALRELSHGLVAVTARLAPKEASTLHVQAAALLTQVMANERADGYARSVALEGLSVVAAHLEPRAAATIFLQAMSQAPNGHYLQILAHGLAEAASRLDAKEASEVSARAAAILIPSMRQTTNPAENHQLAIGLAALANRLDRKAANEAALLLIQTLARIQQDQIQPMMFPSYLVDLLTRQSPDNRSRRLRSMAGSIGLATQPASLSLLPTVLVPAAEPLAEPLPAEMLVELLKHPLCVGAARRAVLDVLGSRYQRTFADQWDFVRFATARKLGLDLASPPKRPEFAASKP